MNSLKVFYKYLLVVVLMMLPIGSLIFKIMTESNSEISRIEKQSHEVGKLFKWAEALSSDAKALLESSTQDEQRLAHLSNFRSNLMGLKDLSLSSILLLDGNEEGLLLNHAALTLIPDAYESLVELQRFNLAGRAFRPYSGLSALVRIRAGNRSEPALAVDGWSQDDPALEA